MHELKAHFSLCEQRKRKDKKIKIMKKMVIAGGSGFLGNSLIAYFLPKNYEIIVLSRNNKETGNDAAKVTYGYDTVFDVHVKFEILGVCSILSICVF